MRLNNPFRIAFVATLGVGLGLVLLQSVNTLSTILLYVGTALFLSLGLDPVVSFLERRKLPRWAAVLVTIIALLGLFAGVVLMILPIIIDQVSQLVVQIERLVTRPSWEHDLKDWLRGVFPNLMVDDVWDTWPHFTHLMNVCQKWYPYIASGTWPDCDMIPLGRISIRGERGDDRITRLTKDEQYSLMTLFTIFRSPLMFGGDMPSNDAFTLSLLTNKDVLKMHREGTDVHQLFQKDEKVAITSRNAKTGEVYLALFNISDSNTPLGLSVELKDLGIHKNKIVLSDMWTGKKMKVSGNNITVLLKKHSCLLYKIQP